ncbi:MAG: hypothetical protein NT007_10360 [Candidatus Kapabacteria bacterium]|nr:hypothetical protein [Candidatus Kapabacteria bacterium]
MNPSKRNYSMSDAELCMFTSNFFPSFPSSGLVTVCSERRGCSQEGAWERGRNHQSEI